MSAAVLTPASARRWLIDLTECPEWTPIPDLVCAAKRHLRHTQPINPDRHTLADAILVLRASGDLP